MKKIQPNRRHFLKTTLATAALVATGGVSLRGSSARAEVPEHGLHVPGWWRGHLHQHSYWSDGSAFVEEACSLYRDAGYEFVIPSDHGLFQADPNRWIELNDDRKQVLDRCATKYAFTMETKVEGDKTLVRLKTFDEISGLLNQPGRFLLIPGHELTTSGSDGVQVHSNLINSRNNLTQEIIDATEGQVPNMYCYGPVAGPKADPKCTGYESVRWSVDVLNRMIGDQPKDERLFMFNHPDWIWFDVQPEWLCEQPDVRFFELINCGPNHPGKEGCWTTDKFWDTVNAFRADSGGELLYGTATDDTHGYGAFYADITTAAGGSVMVRSESLEATALMKAMNAGDFYASTGVWLDDVCFDRSAGTLSVRVRPADGVQYKIEFIGTRRGFNKSFETLDFPKEGPCPARKINVYSDEVGQVFKTVEGTEAAYTLTDDDLYVRARITASCAAPRTMRGKPANPTAWTQPVRK